MNPLILNQKSTLESLFHESDNIGILISEKQNLDTLAAATSFYLSLLQNEKKAQIVSRRNPIVEYSNLVGINKITNKFEGNTKILTIAVPYREGEIEKVSYNIETDKLNVNLFAEEKGISFEERDIKYIKKGSNPSLVIGFGSLTKDDLDFLSNNNDSGKTILIDTNPLNSLQADVLLVDPSFSSLSEIVAELLITLSMPIDIDIAQNLLDGIVYSTRNFSSLETSPFAFQIAGILMQQGALRKNREQRQNKKAFPKEELILDKGAVGKQENLKQDRGGNQTRDSQSLSSGNIPKDWFLPKVFKGSKKPKRE